MSTLRGGPELKARLRAIKLSFKPIGKAWAESTRDAAKPIVPVRTGKGRLSVRVKNASQMRATVSAVYYLAILDKGSKAYSITPRNKNTLVFQSNGRTIFAKKVNKPAQRGLGFGRRASAEGLRKHPMALEVIRQWNEAA